jgi:predicted RNase H-like nuclease
MNAEVYMGWDAAWTENGSGAWAVAVNGTVCVHETTPAGEDLLSRLRDLIEEFKPAVIAVDLPVALGGVRGWRNADLETTRAFSRCGCPVHSPTPARPGEWGDRMVNVMEEKKYHLAVSNPIGDRVFAEVYPHTVLLEIYRRDYRLPYKAGRARQYWPELNREERGVKLLETYRDIWRQLEKTWRLMEFPEPEGLTTGKDLKRIEDLTDALVCLHAAREIQRGRYLPFGDDRAAIWNPNPG